MGRSPFPEQPTRGSRPYQADPVARTGIAGVDGPAGYQARLTFAMARHAAVDLALVFVDNWQTSAWMRRSPSLGGLPAAGSEPDHFD
jgi:hypothetical protein